MTQTNEELKTKLYKIMSKDLVLSAKTHIEVMNAINEIMSLIPQHEQLEVEIVSLTKFTENSRDNFFILFKNSSFECSDYFKTKQEALDFCKRFNLKVTNEPEGKGKDMSGISNDRKFTKFKIGERVIGENISGDIVKLTVGGYMDQPPIPLADWKYQFFDKGNEEDGWYDDRNFREMTGIELLEVLAEQST
jgi:hypothetical protein